MYVNSVNNSEEDTKILMYSVYGWQDLNIYIGLVQAEIVNTII